MKKLLVLAALGTILAAPAFAQSDPRGRTQRPSTVPPGGIYYYVTTQVSLSRALEFGDEPFWVCGEGVEHIPTLFFRR
jgi:hypothetical protein